MIGRSSLVTVAFVACTLLSARSSAHPLASSDSDHKSAGSLLTAIDSRGWAHSEDHPAHSLFRRQVNVTSAAAVGSSAWLKQYPAGYETPDPTKMPQAWQDALTALENTGNIPDIPLTTGSGTYPSGTSGASKSVCNSAAMCRAPGDIWDAPDGMLGVSFDDGPTSNSPALYDFLKQNNQRATHFFIGSNIEAYPKIFLQAFANGDDIAVHTWSHPFSTTKTNAEFVSELGWTIQIIYDLTGGRIPRYWRAPNGDSDLRTRYIAQHLFGLTMVAWNQDTDDWEVGIHKTTPAKIAAALQKFINGPKSPGLIILEHELYPQTVQAFIDAYPDMKSLGWDTRSIPDLFGMSYYLNSDDDSSPVSPLSIVSGGSTTVSLAPNASPSAAASTTSTMAAGGTASYKSSALSLRASIHLLGFALIPLSIFYFSSP